MRSLSKVGLAGLRVGALVGAREAIAELDKVRLPWNVSAVAIALGRAALARSELLRGRIRVVVELRQAFEGALREVPGLVVYPSAANFLLVRVPTDATSVFRGLLRHGVLVKDVSRPGLLERCLRITVGTSSENERCARALRELLQTRKISANAGTGAES
jgi:histidinol-phosphate aminotransferase